jgi:nucleotidyltransferase/DNA polymerase involved in DNA repair
MIVTAVIPRFALLVALLAARRPMDAPITLGPQPGDAQLVGQCTPAAAAAGVSPGLRVGEALARCPDLELVVPDPAAVEHAAEEITERLEAMGAAVEPGEVGAWTFATHGLERLHGGLDGVLRHTKAALPVGADGRIGAAPTPFAALQAALEAPPRTPLVVAHDEIADFLAPLPVDRLPLEPKAIAELMNLGLTTIGHLADLPRAAVLDRLGLAGLRAWRCARGDDDDALRPRRPPDPLEAAFHFPEPVAALPALEAATRLLLTELASAARGRGRALRTLTIRAWLEGGGSWTRTLALRDPTTQLDRLATLALPSLAEVSGPVDTLVIRADASGSAAGHQLAVIEPGDAERERRARDAIRQVRTAQGDEAVLRLVELEPWSRLPERRWALVPYDVSASPDPSA